MKRLRILILLFIVILCVPLGYFIMRTLYSLAQEEKSELRYFSETLFNEIEQELAVWVRNEESRAVDEYNYLVEDMSTTIKRSPLSKPPEQPFILGYFQNNPDGSFQSPYIQQGGVISEIDASMIKQLKNLNSKFNQKRYQVPLPSEYQPVLETKLKEPKAQTEFSEKYLARSRKSSDSLGQKQKRVESIRMEQALNIAQQEMYSAKEEKETILSSKVSSDKLDKTDRMNESWTGIHDQTLQVEVDSMQSVFIDNECIYIFRRIAMRNQIYRQGCIIQINPFLVYLSQKYFDHQPMSQFTHMVFVVADGQKEMGVIHSGIHFSTPVFEVHRIFPRPFSFLRARLTCASIPPSSGRMTLQWMIFILAGVIVIGLVAIYHSAWKVMELSHRRSQFVSSVTHELKTPLTNIRMYIEMLEQGIATTHEREQQYYHILSSECQRLSRLIYNVLDFSKLEKKQIKLNWNEGKFDEVIDEVEEIMTPKLQKEGFTFDVNQTLSVPFWYDREIMVQVLMNMIENSIKFGKHSPEKKITLSIVEKGKWIEIHLSDTGPGIANFALKKVFEDFYRVDPLAKTSGTGIGLAFVRKLIHACGGKVRAENNTGAGCSIIVMLPKIHHP
ncbi:MAG: HAMP domain-containing histidine kinase [Desulfobacterales bacterium]|nr:HAMP domain-containing histidine kinase [Desulfobacterales bacterium]